MSGKLQIGRVVFHSIEKPPTHGEPKTYAQELETLIYWQNRKLGRCREAMRRALSLRDTGSMRNALIDALRDIFPIGDNP